MSRHGIARVVVAIALVGLPARACRAQGADGQGGEKYALLVGVRKYDPNELRDLPFAEADVTELAEVLRANGYKTGNVVLMTQTVGSSEPRLLPMAANIRKELALLLDGLEKDDSVLIALAGHGVQLRGDAENYFCPGDARLADKSTLIGLGELYKALDGCNARVKLLLVDACRDDPLAAISRARPTADLESVTRPRQADPPGGIAALFSCSAGERAFEHPDLKHGVFFHYVIEGLRGRGTPPAEADVLLPDLEKFVKRGVRDFVREKYGVRQMPELRGTTRDLVPIVHLHNRAATTRRSLKPVRAPLAEPTAIEQATAKAVVSLLESRHLDRPRVDDELARKWCRNFLRALDPNKFYFLKADVDEFVARDTTLDDRIRQGDLSFASQVYARYLERVEVRLEEADEAIRGRPDLQADEAYMANADQKDWPADADRAREQVRLWVKYRLLDYMAAGADREEASRKLSVWIRDEARSIRQAEAADLLERYLNALAKAADSSSIYFSPTSFEDEQNRINPHLVGIGATLRIEDGLTAVTAVVPGGAADRDGRLKPGDRLLGIEREGGGFEEFAERRLAEVVRSIRGAEGTRVRLVVRPGGGAGREVYELTRRRLVIAAEHARGEVVEARRDGAVCRVGVLRLPSFYGDGPAVERGDPNAQSATRDCRRLLEGFRAQGVDAVLVDLRNNGGGLINEAVSLSGLFVGKGPIVQVRDPASTRTLKNTKEDEAFPGPVVLLVNHYSASAPEILAGVVQDCGRGLVIGDSTTFGKGTVQSLVALNNEIFKGDLRPNVGALKVTIQQFYRVNGASTQIRGVVPDLHIPSILDVSDILTEARLESATRFDQIKALPHDRLNQAPAVLVGRLDARSQARRQADPKFRAELERIRRFSDSRTRSSTPLNEERYRARTASIAAPPAPAPTKAGAGPLWPSGFYEDEVLAIVADYVAARKEAAAGTAAVNLVNADPAKEIYLARHGEAANFTLAAGASRQEALSLAGPFKYFAKPTSTDPLDWRRFGIDGAGTLRFKLVDGVWTPDFQAGPGR